MVLKSAPPGSTIVGIPGRNVKEKRKCAIDLDHGELPDPIAEVIRLILQRQDEMEMQLKALGLSTTTVNIDELFNRKSEIEEIFSEGAGI